ncbi:MAG: queuosine precursor transporter [Parachlamydiaceae bacterium]
MNEFIFFCQILLILGFALGALKLGKEALIVWVAIQALIANLFVLKQITLFGLEVTASDAFAIGSLLGLNFLQEFYSREDANKATKICFFFMFFFALVSQLHLLYEPNAYDTTHSAFLTLLILSPRLLIASMSVFFIVQQIDIRFFAFLKKTLPHLDFGWRSLISLVLSQLLDTVLFSFAGLYGVVTSVIDIIAVSFLIKMIVIFSFTSCARWAKT